MPPELYVDIDFTDANDNKILEAQENGTIKLTLMNKGGKSDAVTVSVSPVNQCKGLTFDKRLTKTSVDADGTSVLEFPISAGIDIPTDSLEFAVKVSEPLGYDIDATLMLGYGWRSLMWDDIDGEWALVSDRSYKGIAAEAGVLVSFRRLALSAGISSIAFRTAALTLGLGIVF